MSLVSKPDIYEEDDNERGSKEYSFDRRLFKRYNS